jgi:hypothetical protein
VLNGCSDATQRTDLGGTVPARCIKAEKKPVIRGIGSPPSRPCRKE